MEKGLRKVKVTATKSGESDLEKTESSSKRGKPTIVSSVFHGAEPRIRALMSGRGHPLSGTWETWMAPNVDRLRIWAIRGWVRSRQVPPRGLWVVWADEGTETGTQLVWERKGTETGTQLVLTEPRN